MSQRVYHLGVKDDYERIGPLIEMILITYVSGVWDYLRYR